MDTTGTYRDRDAIKTRHESGDHAMVYAAAMVLCEERARFEAPRFMIIDQPDKYRHPTDRALVYGLAEMLQGNAEDAEFCEWLRSTEVGYHYALGGGAAPLVHVWRVS